eukprot:m.134186 g.134186  ORF g.134186 m.134186 type:complete len:406 (+) comp14690_c0_seq1:144-1361(+)
MERTKDIGPAYLAGLTADGGVPLFTRVVGHDVPPLGFASIGSLYGISVFLEGQGAKIRVSSTTSSTVVWKTFYDRIILILVCDCHVGHENLAEDFLDLLFFSLQLIMGESELKVASSKLMIAFREQENFQALDVLLGSLRYGTYIGPRLGLVQMALKSEKLELQRGLHEFCNALNAHCAALFIHGYFAAGTSSWDSLSHVDRILLCAAVQSQSGSGPHELPVYPPHDSPDVPFRLLVFDILPGVQAMALCGAEPTKEYIVENILAPVWSQVQGSLKSSCEIGPLELPRTVHALEQVQCIVLFCRGLGVCSTLSVQNNQSNETSQSHRAQILCSWYSSLDLDKDSKQHFQPKESYIVKDDYCAYMMRIDHELKLDLVALLDSNVPRYAMRGIIKVTEQSLRRHNFI